MSSGASLRGETVGEIDEFWAHIFSADGNGLWRPGVHVSPHRPGTGFAAFGGLFVLVRGDACRITAPPVLVDEVRDRADAWTASDGVDPERWRELLGPASTTSGPSWQGHADATTVQAPPADATDVREVAWTEIRALEAYSNQDEWELAGLHRDDSRYFLLFSAGEPVAAATLTRWRHAHDEVTVLTLPGHRGRGYGAVVAGAAAKIAVAEYGISRYRAHLTNRASMAIGARIGYRDYAIQLSVVPAAS